MANERMNLPQSVKDCYMLWREGSDGERFNPDAIVDALRWCHRMDLITTVEYSEMLEYWHSLGSVRLGVWKSWKDEFNTELVRKSSSSD